MSKATKACEFEQKGGVNKKGLQEKILLENIFKWAKIEVYSGIRRYFGLRQLYKEKRELLSQKTFCIAIKV